MKDFAKSIVCNTKAVATKVGNAPYKGAKPNYNGVSDSELKSWLRMAEQDLKDAKRDMDKANHDYRGAEITERDKVVGKYAEQIYEANRVIYNITEELKERERNKHGNTKVGNYVPNYRYKGFLITNPEGYEFVVFLKDGLHVAFRGTTSKAVAEDWCDWHDPKTGKPVKNKKSGNTKVGNATIVDLMGQAKEYNTKFWEAYRKGDQKEAEKWAGYAKILKRQIADERSDIQQRLKKLDEAEKMISFSY